MPDDIEIFPHCEQSSQTREQQSPVSRAKTRSAMSTEPRYRQCPTCERSVNLASDERFCAHDGTKMLESCPHCNASIRVAGAKFCGACGAQYQTAPLHAINQTRDLGDSSAALLTPAPNASWTATRRGRAAAILAILTLVGVVVTIGFNRQPLLHEASFVRQVEFAGLDQPAVRWADPMMN